MTAKNITLVNPWTKQPTTREMTWNQIKEWGNNHIHPNDLGEWIKNAWKAYKHNDGDTLGTMIIGS